MRAAPRQLQTSQVRRRARTQRISRGLPLAGTVATVMVSPSSPDRFAAPRRCIVGMMQSNPSCTTWRAFWQRSAEEAKGPERRPKAAVTPTFSKLSGDRSPGRRLQGPSEQNAPSLVAMPRGCGRGVKWHEFQKGVKGYFADCCV